MLPRHEDLNVKEGRMPLLFVIVGILVTLMIMGALLTAILAVRRQRAAKLNQIEIQSGSSSGEEMGEFVWFRLTEKKLISLILYIQKFIYFLLCLICNLSTLNT